MMMPFSFLVYFFYSLLFLFLYTQNPFLQNILSWFYMCHILVVFLFIIYRYTVIWPSFHYIYIQFWYKKNKEKQHKVIKFFFKKQQKKTSSEASKKVVKSAMQYYNNIHLFLRQLYNDAVVQHVFNKLIINSCFLKC